MSFEATRRHGRFWDDANTFNNIVTEHNFNTSGKDEKHFENGLAQALSTRKNDFNCNVISQINNETTVKSVYCFGKSHRPDITLDENGIAIELKFIKAGGLREAIGQGYLYRLKYRFVFLVLVISEKKKAMYEDLCIGKESDLENTLQHLADNMNIFTYIVPAFNLKPGMKKCHDFFKPINV